MPLDWREVAREVVARREAFKKEDHVGVAEALLSRRYLVDRSHTSSRAITNPAMTTVVADKFDIRVAACVSSTVFEVKPGDEGVVEPDWTQFLFQSGTMASCEMEVTNEVEVVAGTEIMLHEGSLSIESNSPELSPAPEMLEHMDKVLVDKKEEVSRRRPSLGTFQPVQLPNYNKLRDKRRLALGTEPTVSLEQKEEACSSSSQSSIRLAIFVDDVPAGVAMHHSLLSTKQQNELKRAVFQKLKKNVSKRCKKEFEGIGTAISSYLGSLPCRSNKQKDVIGRVSRSSVKKNAQKRQYVTTSCDSDEVVVEEGVFPVPESVLDPEPTSTPTPSNTRDRSIDQTSRADSVGKAAAGKRRTRDSSGRLSGPPASISSPTLTSRTITTVVPPKLRVQMKAGCKAALHSQAIYPVVGTRRGRASLSEQGKVLYPVHSLRTRLKKDPSGAISKAGVVSKCDTSRSQPDEHTAKLSPFSNSSVPHTPAALSSSLSKLALATPKKGPLYSVMANSSLRTRELSSPGDSSSDESVDGAGTSGSRKRGDGSESMRERRNSTKEDNHEVLPTKGTVPTPSTSTEPAPVATGISPTKKDPISMFDPDIRSVLLSPEQKPILRQGDWRRDDEITVEVQVLSPPRGSNSREPPPTSAKRGRGRPRTSEKGTRSVSQKESQTPSTSRTPTRASFRDLRKAEFTPIEFSEQPPVTNLFEPTNQASGSQVKEELMSPFTSPLRMKEVSQSQVPCSSRDEDEISIIHFDSQGNAVESEDSVSRSSPPESPEIMILEPPMCTDDVKVDHVIVAREFMCKPERESTSVQRLHSPFSTVSTTVAHGNHVIRSADYFVADRMDDDTIPFPTCQSAVDMHMFSFLVRVLATNPRNAYNHLPEYMDRYDGIPDNFLNLFVEFSPPIIEERDIDPTKMTDSFTSLLSIEGYELLTKKKIPGQLTMHKFIALIEFAIQRSAAFWDTLKTSVRLKKVDMNAGQAQWKDASDSVLYQLCSTIRRMAEATSICTKANSESTKLRFELLYYGWRSFLMQGGALRVFLHIFAQRCHKKLSFGARQLMDKFDSILTEARSMIRLSSAVRVERMALEYGVTSEQWNEVLIGVYDIESVKFPHKCRKCKVWFRSEELLNRHMFIHGPVTRLMCSVCMCDFRYKLSLCMHFLDRHLDKILTEPC